MKLNHYFNPKEYNLLNILQHPVWIFDVDQKSMLWANTAALVVWNAPTLESLLERDFQCNVTPATNTRMHELSLKLHRNEVVKEAWTFYPKGQATTMSMTMSAIQIDESGRIGCLAEAEIPDHSVFHESTVRGIELLRHLPFAVSQFSMDGKLIYQNPEGVRLFGTPKIETNGMSTSSSSSCAATTDCIQNDDSFINHFVDVEFGMMALRQMQNGDDFSGEAQYKTLQGNKWFAITLRRTRDPVTSEYIILHSIRDISDIMQARQESARATQFLAVMAHEIRTPLHQIIGCVDLLEGACVPSGQLDTVKQIQSSTSGLMSIINDLLDYTKLDVGQMQIENVTFELGELINGCLACIQPETDRKSLVLKSSVSSDIQPECIGDPNRLRQIIINLLSNAVKFTDHGSIILSISCLERSDVHQRLRFAVTDTGIGIDPAEQAAVFQKYRQANASVARHFGGTGLGLAICEGLVRLLGGIIGLESEVGKGTTVFFEVPFQLPPVSMLSSDITRYDDAMSCAYSFVPWKILVVEDNKINQKVMKAMLQRIGHSAVTVENGQLALNELHRQQFDLILMDVQMPVMDGIECTKHIRQLLGLDKSRVRIIGLTAGYLNSEKEYYENEVGMNSCLGKPIRMENLKSAISNLQQEPIG